MALLLLRAVLIGRCLLDLGFAWHMQLLGDPTPYRIADAFAPFALVDGIAAVAVTGLWLSARLPPDIAALSAIDAFLRLTAASALHFGPGIAYFPMTIVLYVALLASFAFAFGIAESIEARHLEHEVGLRPLTVVVGIAGVVTVVLAVIQFVMLPVASTVKHLVSAGVLLQGLTMLGIAFSVRDAQQALVTHQHSVSPGADSANYHLVAERKATGLSGKP